MRRSLTPAERKLWFALRQRILLQGTHFRRQVSLGPYIADFCCLAGKLIVEVDGGQHFSDEAEAYDTARTHYLNKQGFTVLRFSNRDVFSATDEVLATINASLEYASRAENSLPAIPCPAGRSRLQMEP